MPDIIGTSLKLVASVSDTASLELDRPGVSSSININGTTFLYVPAENDDAVQIFTVAVDGSLTAVGAVVDTGGLTLNGVREVRAFEVNGTPFLAVAGNQDSGITVFSLSDGPPYMTFADRVQDTDNSNYQLLGLWNITVAESGGTTTIIAAGYSDAGISTFRVGNDGTLTNAYNIDDSADSALKLSQPLLSDPIDFGGVTHFAVGSNAESALTLFQLASTGVANLRATYDGAAAGVRPYQSAGIQSGTNFYIVSTDFAGDALHLFRYDGFSTITLVQTITAPVLDQAFGIEVVQLGDRFLVMTSSFATAGVQVWELDTALARLERVEGYTHASGQGDLWRSHVSTPFTLDGRTYMAVSSESTDDVNIYEIGGGDDVLEGTQVRDRIWGRGGDDVLFGLAGDDDLHGEYGADVLYGGSGNDLIDGGSGADIVFGGSGNDRVAVSYGADILYGGEGDDTLTAIDLFQTAGTGLWISLETGFIVLPDGKVQSFAEFETVAGSARDDTLIGSAGADHMIGEAGNDTLRGEAGADLLLGVFGDDTIEGGEGDDSLYGSDGQDSLSGEAGNDTLDGGLGNDMLAGGAGNDILYGGAADDSLLGGAGNDSVSGDSGNDALGGGEGADWLAGGNNDDVLTGGNGADLLFGGSGNDSANGDAGADEVHGDGGDDFLAGGGGNDMLFGGSGNDQVFGSKADDSLHGGDGDDLLNGNADNDRLSGDGGNDTLRGSTGTDTLDGGAGNDTLDGGADADVFLFGAGGGTDTILDFRNDVDTLGLSAGLWTGVRTAQQVIDDFAASAGGRTTFAFDGGEVLVIEGIADRQLLVDDLAFFT